MPHALESDGMVDYILPIFVCGYVTLITYLFELRIVLCVFRTWTSRTLQ